MRNAMVILLALTALAGCGGKSSATSNAEYGLAGAALGASEALFRFDLLAGCWIAGEGAASTEQSVSGICQSSQPTTEPAK